ncbi:MAG: DUF58 domain-containing protein [Gammaproteobacteria bacterium]|nr:DUF58 domain-containing protein [Gammaproteobacteria bacterium]
MSQSDITTPPPSDDGDGLIYVSQSQLIALRAAGERLQLKQQRIGSVQSGNYSSRFKGRGMEFDESRQYQPGDDVRSLDWRVTARTGVAHTKLFREERERPVIGWVDLRPSMFFATRGVFKSVVAAKAAALISWSATKHGDRFGGMIFSDTEHYECRPHHGKDATLHWIKQLSEASRWSHEQSTSSTAEATDTLSALMRLRRVAKPGSLLFLFSDFRQLNTAVSLQIGKLARHNDIVLFHIFDSLEQNLPSSGDYAIAWQQRFSRFSSNDKTRLQHQLQFKRLVEQLERIARIPGVHLIHCATNDDITQKLVDTFHAKRS